VGTELVGPDAGTIDPGDSTPASRLRAAATPWRLWLLLGTITVLLGGAAVLWAVAPLPSADALADRIRTAGALGPIVLVSLLMLQCIIAPLPSEPMMLAAGFVYGPLTGFALAWLGVVLGAAASFALARMFGRPFVRRFVATSKLDELDRYVGERGVAGTFVAVLALRLVSFSSFDVVSYGCGLVYFPFRWFLLATTIGAVPKAFAFTYLGSSAGTIPGWVHGLIVAGTVSTLLIVPWLAWRRRQRVGNG